MATTVKKTSPKRPRILRVGVILGGNIIEERLIRNREDITIGQSSKNTFSAPLETLPKSWSLFTVENGRYHLHFREDMDGRVSDGTGVHTLSGLKAKGATKKGSKWSIPLSSSSRGKIVAGDLTLLFQFVAAPPLQPRPRLPASVRGSFADRIEPRLAIILAISLLTHGVFVVIALKHDRKILTRTEMITQQFAEERTVTDVQFDIPLTPEDDKPSDAVPEKDAPKMRDKPVKKKDDGGGDKNKKDDKPKSDDNGGGAKDDGGEADAAVQEAIASNPFIDSLTGQGSEKGRYADVSDTDQGAGLNESIKDVRDSGAKVVAGAGRGGKTRGPNTGKLAKGKGGGGVKGPGVGGGTGTKVEEKRSLAKYDVLDVGSDTTLDPTAVARRIRERYLAGIKSCHQRALKLDPKIGGRVNIRFTVGASGRVTKANVKGFDNTVDSCIQGLTKGWRFGIPKDDKGKPSSADFQVPLILKAGN